tara:strand:- start:8047 stop:9195 length:1149 start_codon:yes stop_codon:yes gene_type:complete
MSEEDKKRTIRRLVLNEDGKRDTEGILNQEKDLSDRFCNRPFDFLEAHDLRVGKTFVCCPTWLPTSIGNLTESSVEEVFNSEQAQEVRKSILDGSFCKCDHKLCPLIQNGTLPKKKDIKNKRHKKIINKKIIKGLEPTYYNLCYDESCNLQCPSCRANKFFLKEGPDYERKLRIQEKIVTDLFLIPHDRHATVNITGSGDPFGSKLFRDLLFSIDGSKCPNIKITLQTNGVMFTPSYWKKMNKIQKNIDTVLVSLDAAKKSTYDITRRGGNWKALMANLKFVSELRKKNLINWLRLDFVVQKDNYKDMPGFVKIGRKLGVDQVYFSFMADWGTWPKDVYEEKAIWKKTNSKFKDFMRIMNNPIFDHPIVDLGNVTEYRKRAK